MGIKYWKRMREETAKHADDPRPGGENPWDADRPPTLSQLGALLADSPADDATTIDLDAEDVRSARYNDWADRMREKRKRAQAMQGIGPDTSTEEPATYWSSDVLYEESRRVDEEELRNRPNPWRVQELLAVLDLREGASHDEIGDAYRHLAKQHHPDRYVEADEATQQFHAAKMREVIDAYHALKALSQSPT